MNTLKGLLISVVTMSMLGLATPSQANPDENNSPQKATSKTSIEVTWGDFDKFRDVRSANEHKGAFHKRVKKSFEKFFDEYSKELSEGQILTVDINDLDLAGEVLLGSGNEVRIMKDLYFPRMQFSYSLTDADGTVIKQGDAKLKDMNYLYHEKTWKRYSQGFYYEKRMFREWFEETISKS